VAETCTARCIYRGPVATGGPGNFGGVFEVSSNGTLLNMVWLDGATDGATPQSPLISVGNGIFYGTGLDRRLRE
jgi:hypothetical protein